MQDIVFVRPLFGKNIQITLKDVDPVIARDILEESYLLGLKLSKIFNVYDKESEISLLNQKRKMKVSYELIEVIKLAEKFFIMTKGKYDITLGKLIKSRKAGLKEEAPNCSYKDITIKGNEVSLNNPHVLLDLGSIAKGYIVQKVSDFLVLEGLSQGLVDGRGDIRVFGDKKEVIGIENPRKKDDIIKYIGLKNLGVATSGDYNQFYGSYEKSHIINQKEAISITVVSDSLAEADAFATALFVSTKKEIDSILNQNRDIKAFIIYKNMDIKCYNGFENLIEDVK